MGAEKSTGYEGEFTLGGTQYAVRSFSVDTDDNERETTSSDDGGFTNHDRGNKSLEGRIEAVYAPSEILTSNAIGLRDSVPGRRSQGGRPVEQNGRVAVDGGGDQVPRPFSSPGGDDRDKRRPPPKLGKWRELIRDALGIGFLPEDVGRLTIPQFQAIFGEDPSQGQMMATAQRIKEQQAKEYRRELRARLTRQPRRRRGR